jgi:hypothetical protein
MMMTPPMAMTMAIATMTTVMMGTREWGAGGNGGDGVEAGQEAAALIVVRSALADDGDGEGGGVSVLQSVRNMFFDEFHKFVGIFDRR